MLLLNTKWKTFTPLDNFISNGARILKCKMKLKYQKSMSWACEGPEQNKFDFCILFRRNSFGAIFIFQWSEATSRADQAVAWLQVVLKELRESLYWLRLIKKSNLITTRSLEVLMQEAKELANIIAKSIVTAKEK